MIDDDGQWRPGSDWWATAACRGTDPELFFPVENIRFSRVQVAEAKQVCRDCPVRAACLGWAQRNYQDEGIWGGLTTNERHALRLRRRRSA